MADWQVTATGIYCDAVDDDVTIMVFPDWSTKCTGYRKYVELGNRETARILHKKSRILGRKLQCEGPQDFRVVNYRDMLASQDKAAPGNSISGRKVSE